MPLVIRAVHFNFELTFFIPGAEERLQQLEKERKILDEQLKHAHNKIRLSEGQKEALEAQLYQVAPNIKEGEKIRRCHSFMPSTKERPVTIEVRASTLKRPNK